MNSGCSALDLENHKQKESHGLFIAGLFQRVRIRPYFWLFAAQHAAISPISSNGEWRGGTAATVRYARKLGRKLMILNPTSLEFTNE